MTIEVKDSYVLLSGGLDSTTCLYYALENYETVAAVSVDYGQRHKKEIGIAKELCDYVFIKHTVLNARDLIPKTMLTDENSKVPDIAYDEIEGESPMYVPFRNGTLISLLTAYIEGEIQKEKAHLIKEGFDGETIIPREVALLFGAHSEDAQNWAYPDCTPEFIGAMGNAVYIGSNQRIRLVTPLQWLDKAGVVSLGTSLHAPLHKTWSCYKGGEFHCGTCPTCQSRKEAFKKARVVDATMYSNELVA